MTNQVRVLRLAMNSSMDLVGLIATLQNEEYLVWHLWVIFMTELYDFYFPWYVFDLMIWSCDFAYSCSQWCILHSHPQRKPLRHLSFQTKCVVTRLAQKMCWTLLLVDSCTKAASSGSFDIKASRKYTPTSWLEMIILLYTDCVILTAVVCPRRRLLPYLLGWWKSWVITQSTLATGMEDLIILWVKVIWKTKHKINAVAISYFLLVSVCLPDHIKIVGADGIGFQECQD